MPSYSLQINIDPTSVSQIYQAGQQIVITKQVTSTAGSSVAWVTFTPYQSNTVTWEDNYAVYTSQTLVQAGATIQQLASSAATPMSAYSFSNNVFTLTTPRSTLSSGTYEIVNQSGQLLTFGLAQTANVNGNTVNSTPIFAATLFNGQWLDMTPYETIGVFLQSSVRTAMCLGVTTGPTCTVGFGGATANQTINFVPTIGGFQVSNS